MNDTSPEVEKKMQQMMRLKSPEERASMGWSMYETSKLLIIEAILRNNPQISEAGLRREIFLKFYEDDFSSEEKEKILLHLDKL